MDFNNIDYKNITNRALGATGAIFLVSIADKELAKMGTPEKPNMLFEYRHYAYAVLGALLPSLMPPTKNKDDFATEYESAIRAFSDGLLFFGASQILENNLPAGYVRIDGVSQGFANYVMGTEPVQANTQFAMQNYVVGAPSEAVMLIERETGDQVFIDPNTGEYVKPMREQPMPLPKSMQDQFTMNC